MVRPTDEELLAIGQIVCYGSQGGAQRRSQEEAAVICQETERIRGKCRHIIYCGFCEEKWVRQGKQVSDWLV